MKLLLPTLLLLPSVTLAAAPKNFEDLVDILLGIIASFIPFLFILTIMILIWGIFKAWILHGDDASEIEKGRKLVFVGVIVLIIMTGVWGIVALLRTSLFG